MLRAVLGAYGACVLRNGHSRFRLSNGDAFMCKVVKFLAVSETQMKRRKSEL